MRGGDTDGKDKPTKKSGTLGEGYDAAFRGYVNINLTAEQKAAFDKWSGSASVTETLNAAVADGVNLSLKYEAKAKTFLASGTQRREGSPNAGLVVTARGSEPQKAFLRLLFTLAFLSRTPRWEDTQPVADPDRW